MRTLTALLLGPALILSACAAAPSASPPPSTQPPGPARPVPPSPVGTPVGLPITAVIGAAGGQLQLPGGSVTIDIPAGALSADQLVGLQEMTNTAPGQVGKAYRLTPEGVNFARPVRLTFRYTDEEAVGSAPEGLSLGYQDHAGVWQMYRQPTRNPAARTVSVETSHFSTWSLLAGLQLLPPQAKVRAGQTVQLSVVDCADDTELNPDALTVPIFECAPAPLAFTAKNWSVNGTPGGSGSVGTVVGAGVRGTATYTAPGKQPSRNPVAVSTQVTDLSGQTFTLLSNVTVKDGQAWQGTVTYSETATKAWNAAAPWVGGGQATYENKQVYTVTGSEASDGSLNLALEQSGTATYNQEDHQEWKVYSVCQAGGPEMLREHHISDLKYSMTGLLKAAAKANLRVVDGGYRLTVNTAYGQMGGPYTKWSWYKLYCGGGGQDDRVNRTETYSMSASIDRVLEGRVGPNGEIKGSYEARGQVLSLPTTIRVEWNLSPGTK